jgi:hypothetical protein
MQNRGTRIEISHRPCFANIVFPTETLTTTIPMTGSAAAPEIDHDPEATAPLKGRQLCTKSATIHLDLDNHPHREPGIQSMAYWILDTGRFARRIAGAAR